MNFYMEDKYLTIVEHLGEFRRRIIYILISVAITSFGAYLYNNEILQFIMKVGKIENLVFINPMEAFFVTVKVSFLIGIIGAMPFIFYQVWRYVGIALKPNERKYLIYFGPVSYLLFLCGAALAFRGVIPLAIKFLLSFSRQNIKPMITLDSYITFLNNMILAFGLVFQLPLVILLLSILGIVTPQILKKMRKYAILIIFIFAAVITPSADALSQVMMALPVLILYEISVIICIIVTKKREREQFTVEPVFSLLSRAE